MGSGDARLRSLLQWAYTRCTQPVPLALRSTESGSEACGEESSIVDPLDSTAILDRAVDSLLRPSLARPSSAREATPRAPLAPPSTNQTGLSAIIDNPRVTIRKAEEVLQSIAASGFSVVFRRRIAVAAYLAEIEAQKELAKMRRERPEGPRQWFA